MFLPGKQAEITRVPIGIVQGIGVFSIHSTRNGIEQILTSEFGISQTMGIDHQSAHRKSMEYV